MMTSYRFIVLVLVVLCLPAPAYAVADFEANPSRALDKTEKTLLEETQKQLKLEQELIEREQDLQAEREKRVSIAAAIQQNEENLRGTEQRITRLEENKLKINTQLKNDRASIGRLILSLERIRRMPPEAMLVNPQSPYKTAQSALLMGHIIPALKRHTTSLEKNLETLDQVTVELQKEQEEFLKDSQSLSTQHSELSGLLQKKEDAFKKAHQDYQAREATIQRISLKAQNLGDLVEKLKADERQAQERKKQEQEKQQEQEFAKAQAEYSSAQIRLPVNGMIKIHYHEKDDLGAKSNGLTIEGRAGGLVVAPMAGIVQFAGVFKKYGNIIIIEHADGYHSLVAGLEKIDTLVGEHVESGEPIGAAAQGGGADRNPRIYYELRKNGKPVDPSLKFANRG